MDDILVNSINFRTQNDMEKIKLNIPPNQKFKMSYLNLEDGGKQFYLFHFKDQQKTISKLIKVTTENDDNLNLFLDYFRFYSLLNEQFYLGV